MKSQLVKSHFVSLKKGIPTPAESLFTWKKFASEIKGSDGSVYFALSDVEAPDSWSQLAVDIAASKYFRKSGLPGGKQETSVRQIVRRVVSAITEAGIQQKVFTRAEGKIFAEELKYILLSQRASFNSPVWFNCGLFQSYKIKSDAGAWTWKKNKATFQKNAYENPQVSACFIQSIDDNLDSIFDLVKNEARLFKFGSGSGTNFSRLRSKYEALAGGGSSSGLISFLEVLDRAAGSIKSGGTTRRAAKMVSLDADHPEIFDFVKWKQHEEEKAKALIREGYNGDFEGEAYKTVSGQNANNSVRVTDEFMQAVERDDRWALTARVSGETVKSVKARELWSTIEKAAWACADPGLQFHDTINQWHTSSTSGEIRASNPCSEYMFLDDSSCNLASLNLVKFLNDDGQFDELGYRHTARVMFLAQEILVDFASYPTKIICENSHQFRPLGLGFCGLGAMLMRLGLAYDSDQGRDVAGVLCAFLHGEAYATSAELAKKMGPFPGYKKNKSAMQAVMNRHALAASQLVQDVQRAHLQIFSAKVLEDFDLLWKNLIKLGKKTGYRNAQATVMAPTGTIGLVMDCDTTGVEPEFSLIRYKKLAGGGNLKMVSSSVQPALARLGYSAKDQEKILKHVADFETIEGAPGLKPEHLPIFDCAQKNGSRGKRFLSSEAHLKMMAVLQPFLSGAISKTVNLPNETSAEEIGKIYRQAWKMGLKAIAIYRDGCKSSQPLKTKDYPKCADCGADTELIGGCFRCPKCGFTTGCVS